MPNVVSSFNTQRQLKEVNIFIQVLSFVLITGAGKHVHLAFDIPNCPEDQCSEKGQEQLRRCLESKQHLQAKTFFPSREHN